MIDADSGIATAGYLGQFSHGVFQIVGEKNGPKLESGCSILSKVCLQRFAVETDALKTDAVSRIRDGDSRSVFAEENINLGIIVSTVDGPAEMSVICDRLVDIATRMKIGIDGIGARGLGLVEEHEIATGIVRGVDKHKVSDMTLPQRERETGAATRVSLSEVKGRVDEAHRDAQPVPAC